MVSFQVDHDDVINYQKPSKLFCHELKDSTKYNKCK